MTWLLPAGMRPTYVRLESIGMILVLVAVFMIPAVGRLIFETMQGMLYVIEAAVSFGGLW